MHFFGKNNLSVHSTLDFATPLTEFFEEKLHVTAFALEKLIFVRDKERHIRELRSISEK